MLPHTTIKQCSMCKEQKALTAFARDHRKKLGVTSNCKACRARRKRELLKENPEAYKLSQYTPEQRRAWWERTKTARGEYHRAWAARNRERIATYARSRRANNVNNKITSNLRGRLNDALHRHSTRKTASIVNLIGCSIAELRQHLENKFTTGMTWANYGRESDCWQIDHIKPCNEFDLANPVHQKECFHFANMQPLWKMDNLAKRKGDYWRKRLEKSE
jgi:hypothetical protein